MKKHGHTALKAALLISSAFWLSSCTKEAERNDNAWMPRIQISVTEDGLAGAAFLHRWGDTIIALQGAKCLLRESDGGVWAEVHLAGAPDRFRWSLPAMDSTSQRIAFADGEMENERLKLAFVTGRVNVERGFSDVSRSEWVTEKKAVLATDSQSVTLSEPGYRSPLDSGPGIFSAREVLIPYCLVAKTYIGNTRSLGPFNNGVCYSTNSGRTWVMDQISNSHALGPTLRRTDGFYYYFAVNYPAYDLWFSRKPIGGNSWERSQEIAATFAEAWGSYSTAGEADVVHLCWLDSRHEKTKFDPHDPHRRNYEVVYRWRKDSDAGWSTEVILSRSLLYSYAPSLSVEGDKIVIAWAGVKTAKDGHSEHRPNDVYYVTSKDGGKTWAKPLKVTDGAKDGITSGKPQVVLLNGVIHLVYVQGKLSLKQESPGLTKLNQPPWPIYYQHRPFPD